MSSKIKGLYPENTAKKAFFGIASDKEEKEGYEQPKKGREKLRIKRLKGKVFAMRDRIKEGAIWVIYSSAPAAL